MGVQVQCDRHNIHVAGPFTVPEESAFDSVGARQKSQLGRRDTGAAVIVSVQTDDGLISTLHIPTEPFDLIGMNVGRGDFHRGRQIQDDPLVGRRIPDLGHRLADLERVFDFGAAEALWRVFVDNLSFGQRGNQTLDQARAVGRDLFDRVTIESEDQSPLGG